MKLKDLPVDVKFQIEIEDGLQPYTNFLDRIKNRGYVVISLMAIYRLGWELDSWEAVAYKNNRHYKISTDHERLQFEELESHTERIVREKQGTAFGKSLEAMVEAFSKLEIIDKK